VKPFQVKDCILLSKMSGMMPAFNIRDLRDRIANSSPQVIYHHFCENLLVPVFDYPDFRNDFAVWVKRQLEDNVLAERLGIIDPYLYKNMDELRCEVMDILDERLNELIDIPSVPLGHEFYFREAITVVFDTGKKIKDPGEMADAVDRMTNGSVYFHFLEARRRTPAGTDDFTLWLQDFKDQWNDLLQDLKTIDFVFYSLGELRQEISRTVKAAIGRREQNVL